MPYPATLTVARVVTAQALVAFRGNFYSIGPGMAGATVNVRHRLGDQAIEVATTGGAVLARHHREPDGAGVITRAGDHAVALERAVLAAFSDRAPCRSKERRPPSADAVAEATRLHAAAPAAGQHVVIDLGAYITAALASPATLLARTQGHDQ